MSVGMMRPHVHLTPDQATPVALVVGDPGRAALVASMCEKSEELAFNREYRSFLCTHKGSNFLVTSHGVGSAGAAICFEELIQLGVKTIIRAGTAGSLQPDILGQGDVVICHSAVREDKVSELMVPPGFPAVAHPHVYNTLCAKAQELGLLAAGSYVGDAQRITTPSTTSPSTPSSPVASSWRQGQAGNKETEQTPVTADSTATTGTSGEKAPLTKVVCGMTLSSDLFYKSPVLPSTLETFAKANVDIVEMEVSTLFVICRLRGVQAGAVCCVDGSPFRWDKGDYDPSGKKTADGKKAMLTLAIETAIHLTKEALQQKL